MEEKIKKVLAEKVDPLLAGHHGGVVLTKYENDQAWIRMTGSCSTCPSAQYTVEEVIKTVVLEEIPELADIHLDTSVSPDLIDMAKRILNGER